MSKKPRYLDIKGVRHRLVILRILQKDAQGQPTVCAVMTDRDTAILTDNEEENYFITAYIDEINLTT